MIRGRKPARRVLAMIWAPVAFLTAALLRLGRDLPTRWHLFETAGVLPLPLHYYHAHPRAGELERSGFWSRESALAGLEIDLDRAVAFLEGLGREFGAECRWPHTPPAGGGYFDANGAFGFSSAAVAHCMVRRLRPRRIVEVGAGYSTLILAGALGRNADRSSTGSSPELLSIDPFPGPIFARGLPPRVKLDRRPVEAVGLAPFEALVAGDVLSIDSSHAIRYGGDVLFLYLEVLPRLAPGVVVHIHDIHLPEPYPRAYFEEHRWIWNEQYLLQALLCGSETFETLLPCWWLHRARPEAFANAFPAFDSAVHRPGSSYWLRRRPAGSAGNIEHS